MNKFLKAWDDLIDKSLEGRVTVVTQRFAKYPCKHGITHYCQECEDTVITDTKRIDWIDKNWEPFEGVMCRSIDGDIRKTIDQEMNNE